MPKQPSHPIADQFSDEEMEQMKRHGEALNPDQSFSDEVEAALDRKYAKEASAKKMHAAQMGLAPTEMEQAQVKQGAALEQQATTQGAQQAAQAQGQQTQPTPPPAPAGPAGVSQPYPVQRGAQASPGPSAGAPGPGAAPQAPPEAPGGEEED